MLILPMMDQEPTIYIVVCGLGLDQIPLFHKSVYHAKIIAYVVLYDCF